MVLRPVTMRLLPSHSARWHAKDASYCPDMGLLEEKTTTVAVMRADVAATHPN